MNEYYCLDIEFPSVDFSLYYINGKKEISKIHHAHLFIKKENIALKIFYEDQTFFGEKLMQWSSEINSKKFGSFLKINVTKNQTYEHLQKVDLSDANLIGVKFSSTYYENGKKYILVNIDTVKCYWNAVETECYTAEFYLDDKGFRVVEPFHSILTPKTWFKNDGNFNIGRMNDSKIYYKLGKSNFRTAFNFATKDERKLRVSTITKEPKIQFKYRKGITEKKPLFMVMLY
ncbi:MAG: hypothetical protein IPK10_11065 [Bacteroidetes bacterium]|nr:hypothetical protein [Bacteroidota bacterium]